jgi:hypothetical protein
MINVTLTALLLTSIGALIFDRLSVKKSKILYKIFVICLICVAGFRNGVTMPDYQAYTDYYGLIVDGQLDDFLEPSFIYISKLSNLILEKNAVVMFVIYAIIGVSLKAYAIQKLSHLWFYSLVIYISNYFILHEMIQIRAGVAVALIFISIVPLYDRCFRNFVTLIICATLFHFSSIIFLLLWFFNTNRYNKILYISLIPLAYLVDFLISYVNIIGFIAIYMPFDFIAYKLALYSQMPADDSRQLNVFGISPLVKIIILMFFTYFSSLIQCHNKYLYILLKMYAFGVFIYIAMSMYPHIAVRISYSLFLSEIIIVPTLIYIIRGYFFPRLIVILYGLLAFYLNVLFTSYFQYS